MDNEYIEKIEELEQYDEISAILSNIRTSKEERVEGIFFKDTIGKGYILHNNEKFDGDFPTNFEKTKYKYGWSFYDPSGLALIKTKINTKKTYIQYNKQTIAIIKEHNNEKTIQVLIPSDLESTVRNKRINWNIKDDIIQNISKKTETYIKEMLARNVSIQDIETNIKQALDETVEILNGNEKNRTQKTEKRNKTNLLICPNDNFVRVDGLGDHGHYCPLCEGKLILTNWTEETVKNYY
jgi:hypothetical protein